MQADFYLKSTNNYFQLSPVVQFDFGKHEKKMVSLHWLTLLDYQVWYLWDTFFSKLWTLNKAETNKKRSTV